MELDKILFQTSPTQKIILKNFDFLQGSVYEPELKEIR